MPTYAYECPHCGDGAEAVLPIDQRHTGAPECHGPMKLIIQPAMVTPDIKPYQAMGGDKAGQYITSRKEHREFLKRNNFVEIGNEPIKPIKNNFRPAPGAVREELRKVVPQVLQKYRG